NGSLYSVTTGDLDNDGKNEIYGLIWDQMTIRFFETTGADQYELVTSLDNVTDGTDYGAVDGVRVTDVNNDGVNEMYIAGTEPDNTIFIVTNISDVSKITKSDFVPFFKIPSQAEGKLRTMQVADPDGDGNISLMIAGERNGQIFDLEYQGSGDPADSSNWELTVLFDIFETAAVEIGADSAKLLTPRFFYGSAAGDMDKDGKQEYLFVNYSTDFNTWENDKYLWMIEIDQVTDVEKSVATIPNKIELLQNYPNPFNPTTNISFNLSESGFTTLTIFDLLGKKVTTLVDKQMNVGNHKVEFNASNLSAGTYFYELKVTSLAIPNGFVQTKKLLLIK
ncbi:MAG: T9SS type A sorting domain-containing protein, partial [Melioribacteraceae bacterium]